MRILGLDTATWSASVGVEIDGKVVAEQSEETHGSHAVSLLPLIDTVLQRAGCSVRDLDAVAVSCGPGSFTGLRVGLSVAKGLARAGGLQLVAVPTLEALAHTVTDHRGIICPLLDARRGELYAAAFDSSDNGWQRLMDDVLLTAESLIEVLPTPCTVIGDAVVAYGALLQARLGSRVTLLPPDTYGPRGGAVAQLGRERLVAGYSSALPDVEPFYIRPSEAERKAV